MNLTEEIMEEFEKVICNCGTSDNDNHGNLCGYRYYAQQNVNIKSFLLLSLRRQAEAIIGEIEKADISDVFHTWRRMLLEESLRSKYLTPDEEGKKR